MMEPLLPIEKENCYEINYRHLKRSPPWRLITILKCWRKKPTAVLGLATGSTPWGLYAELVRSNQAGQSSSTVSPRLTWMNTWALDASHDQSYRYFMNENLFNHININQAHAMFPPAGHLQRGRPAPMTPPSGRSAVFIGHRHAWSSGLQRAQHPLAPPPMLWS